MRCGLNHVVSNYTLTIITIFIFDSHLDNVSAVEFTFKCTFLGNCQQGLENV